MKNIFTPHPEGIFIYQCPNWDKRRISLGLPHCWNYLPQLWIFSFNVCVYMPMKENKKYPVFILEPICSHAKNTRDSGKGRMDYKRPLNGHKTSGESVLQLSFSRTFLILILIHLEVHSLTVLAFSHLSALLGSCCSVCQHKILFSWGWWQSQPSKAPSISFALLGENEALLDEVLGHWCVDILFK